MIRKTDGKSLIVSIARLETLAGEMRKASDLRQISKIKTATPIRMFLREPPVPHPFINVSAAKLAFGRPLSYMQNELRILHSLASCWVRGF